MTYEENGLYLYNLSGGFTDAGTYDWNVSCTASSHDPAYENDTIDVDTLEEYWYETGTADFADATADIGLALSRDGTENNVDFLLASTTLYDYVNATSPALGETIEIGTTTIVNHGPTA